MFRGSHTSFSCLQCILGAALLCVAAYGIEELPLLGADGGPMTAVAVSGNRAYIAEGSVFKILDVTNSSNPALLGRLLLSGWLYEQVNAIKVHGDFAYVCEGSGLRIIDVSDPTNPVLKASCLEGWGLSDVWLQGTYAYVVGYGTGLGQLQVLDISDPADPRPVGDYGISGDRILAIYVEGNYAYLAAAPEELVILDISNPGSPALAGSYSWTSPLNVTLDVAVSSGHAYVCNGWDGLEVLDVTNPASPSVCWHFDAYAPYVYVAGNYAYLASGCGFKIFDITVPCNPVLAGENGGCFGGPIAVSDNYAYVANVSGLSILDVTYPDYILIRT